MRIDLFDGAVVSVRAREIQNSFSILVRIDLFDGSWTADTLKTASLFQYPRADRLV